MFKFALVALLCAQAYARPSFSIDPFIVGGTPAKEGEFPFIVSLRQPSGFQFCGGALISDRYVLTAAHCVARKTEIRIGAGSVNLNSQKLYDVENIIIYPDYNAFTMVNDTALIKLKNPMPLSDKIKTINFPVKEDLVGKNVTALGWGRTSEHGRPSEVLLHLNRKIISNSECSEKHKQKILDSQICLGCERDYGMCYGDSGSPLVYKGPDGKDYIAGIVSWGVPCAKGYPDVFTRVSSFTSWIKENMV